jgi:hypothetical protein
MLRGKGAGGRGMGDGGVVGKMGVGLEWLLYWKLLGTNQPALDVKVKSTKLLEEPN